MKQTAHNHPNVPQVESRASLLALPRCSNVTEGKHYYAGTDLCGNREQSQACLSYAEMQQSVRSKRLAARIGGGFDRPILREQTDLAMTATHLFKQSQHHSNERHLNAPPAHTIRRDHLPENIYMAMTREFEAPMHLEANVVIKSNDLIRTAQNIVSDNTEPEVYFYHSDHLGSASWITDSAGIPIQHLQYLPYGEPFVNQRAAGSTYSERFRFTGKERDEETGYGYFGARYMDHELMTMWLSVDPLADKYPSVSPYVYCAWNPVKLVDPDGAEIWIGTYNERNRRKYIPNHKGNTGVAAALDKIYKTKAGKFVINSLIKSDNKYFISEKANPSGNDNPGYVDANNQVYLNSGEHGLHPLTLSHELFHAFQDDKGVHGKLRSKEVEAFIFSGIVLSQLNGGAGVVTLSHFMPPGMRDAYAPFDNLSAMGKEYKSAMISLTKGFNATQMGVAVSRFLNFSIEGDRYRNGYGFCGGDGVRYTPRNSLLNKYSEDLY